MATKKAAKTAAKSTKTAAVKRSAKTAAKSSKKTATKKTPSKKAAAKSLPKEGKDPRGGLTQAGRDFYNAQSGGHLKPGVKGAADTPEKKKRKGSFLTRHYTAPRGPVVKDGKPTRQALQAAAWGEPVPRSQTDEKKLAAKGRELLSEYHKATDSKKPKR